MKKIFIKAIVLVISFLIVSLIYFNSSFFICKQQWKYSDGYSIGDWLSLSCETINDGSIIKKVSEEKTEMYYLKRELELSKETIQALKDHLDTLKKQLENKNLKL